MTDTDYSREFLELVKLGQFSNIEKFWMTHNNKIDVNYTEYGLSALHHAIFDNYQNMKILEFLVKKCGVDIDLEFNNSDIIETTPTALHWCVLHNQQNFVKYLLESGADQTIENIFGETAHDLARSYGKNEVVQIFEREPKTKSAYKV